MARAQIIFASAILGNTLLLIGFVLLWNPVGVVAQTNEAEYKGVREYSSCHRTLTTDFATSEHSLTMIASDDEDIPLLVDFSTGEDIRVQLSDEDAPVHTLQITL